MAMTDTRRAPGLFKPALLFAAAAALVTLSSRAPAQEPASPARAYAGEPKARIRGVAAGLDPASFADWIAVHRDMPVRRGAVLLDRATASEILVAPVMAEAA